MSQPKPQANICVDGFNLYYGSLKRTPYRWLDLHTLCAKMLPKYNIHRLRYFTAIVKPRPNNPGVAQRQQAYLRALRATDPTLSIHLGTFLPSQVYMPVVNPPPATILVHKTEE